jgi:hypothetical protein
MPGNPERELAALVEAVDIHTPHRFTFADEPPRDVAIWPREGDPGLGRLHTLVPLVRELALVFYHRGYARRSLERGPRNLPPAADDPGLRARLSAALSAAPEAPSGQAGFWMGQGRTPGSVFDEFDLIRLYFHVSRDGAVPLAGVLSGCLNGRQVPFRLKCLSDPAHYDRCDSSVLFFAKRHLRVVLHLVAEVLDALRPYLVRATPLFTKRLGEGVAAAEEPRTGESFGLHRCRLLAEGCLDAWLAGRWTVAGRLAAIRQRFALNGLDFHRPYLNPDSTDNLHLPENRGDGAVRRLDLRLPNAANHITRTT